MNGPSAISATSAVSFAVEAPVGATATSNAPLLPDPTMSTGDALTELYKLLAASSENQAKDAKANVDANASERKRKLEEHRAAIEEARKAAEEKTGFFDSMGLGSLVAIAVGSPWLAVIDMGMHMAKLTPDFLKDFEKQNLSKIADAANAYGALGDAKTLLEAGLGGPQALAAMVALGGLLVKETNILGEDASDWAGRGMMLGGNAMQGSVRDASIGFVADKRGAVADEIRSVEEETKEYTKVASYVAMAAAAVGACVGTWGAGAPFVAVLVGVALSAGGAVVTETECLGKDWSQWVGLGMMAGGALMTGAGVANAATAAVNATARTVGQATTTAGQVIGATTKVKSGADQVQDAAIQHEVAHHEADAKAAELDAKRLHRMIEQLIDVATDAKDGFRRMASRIQETIEQDARTPLMVVGAMKG